MGLATQILAMCQRRLGGEARQELPLRFAGHELREMTTVKPVRGKTAQNRAGRLVFACRVGPDGSRAKLYEAATATHARFIEALASHEPLAGRLPAVLGVSGPWVLAAWAEGRPLRRKSAEEVVELARFLALLHETPVEALGASGFDYWRDFVRPRFERAASLLADDALAQELVAKVDAVGEDRPARLLHPDLTPVNVLATRSGTLTAVDNELISTGALPLMDVCTAGSAAGRTARSTFLEAYFAARPDAMPDERERDALEAMWLANRVGKHFVLGQTARAQTLLERYRHGERWLPITLHARD